VPLAYETIDVERLFGTPDQVSGQDALPEKFTRFFIHLICVWILSDGELSREAGKKLEKLLRDVKAEAALFELYPRSAAVLIGRDGENLKRLEAKYNKHIYLKGSHYLHPEEVIMSLEGTVAEVEASALPVKVGDVLEGLIEDVHATDPGSGILRLNGYIIQVLDASKLLGQRIRVRVSEVSRTYAVAKIFRNSY